MIYCYMIKLALDAKTENPSEKISEKGVFAEISKLASGSGEVPVNDLEIRPSTSLKVTVTL
ncbi:hypothetical protein EHQ53_01095 [Leptospira langatensis]|uniref:Uncharacterized protein n=1 Tax=Leptospira langatensis TaxID=2484983 RepID=A0ABY2MIL6_9LEPT|nr:hypothetical protein EHQ53_01095 [Leptospira langatensis]